MRDCCGSGKEPPEKPACSASEPAQDAASCCGSASDRASADCCAAQSSPCGAGASADCGGAFGWFAKMIPNCLAYAEKAHGEGRGSCAYLYPDRVCGAPAKFYDPYANDQDWALAMYLMAYGKAAC